MGIYISCDSVTHLPIVPNGQSRDHENTNYVITSDSRYIIRDYHEVISSTSSSTRAGNNFIIVVPYQTTNSTAERAWNL